MCDDQETYLQPSLLKEVDSFTTGDAVVLQTSHCFWRNKCNCGICAAKRIEQRKQEIGF